ncbi:hypothetical protein F7D95_15720 [Prevotella copri]|uniref:CD-NTase-associated protein 12/Pycsar effector protein TIR domain-containing protein n=1 Tax=Segatella copri TaxID=165179 RepID=A0AA90ZNF9_9BACT|nr:TIR domain-containing protein [Segatella copri]MQN14206.1 hypothetical protein [Segatella copri]
MATSAKIQNNYKKITKLDLSNQNLTSFPDYVFKMTNLRKLILHNNHISKIPPQIKALSKLMVLDLSNNELSAIGYQVLKLPKLKILNLCYNQIVYIPDGIKEVGIQQLLLSNNRLSRLNIGGFRRLERLTINCNELSIVALEGVYPLLKDIWMGNNPIKRIAITKTNAPTLRGIYTYTYACNIKNVAEDYKSLMSTKGNVIDIFLGKLKTVNKNVKFKMSIDMNETIKSRLEKLDQLLQDYIYKKKQRVNSYEAIDAFQEWYGEACAVFVKYFGKSDEYIDKFCKIDVTGNGYSLEDSYQEAYPIYRIYIEKLNDMLIGKNDIEMTKTSNNKVFIVHGHDSLKTEVELFLTKLGLEPIILHKQANMGKTIIEKIERYTDVGFGIVLYTPDDEGRLKGNAELSSRARQNVVFEHGYLIGKLGRDRVCALVVDNVEKPGDIDGIVYVNVDDKGYWKVALAKDMKAVGFNIDLNKAF